jgi:hypothetical protein
MGSSTVAFSDVDRFEPSCIDIMTETSLFVGMILARVPNNPSIESYSVPATKKNQPHFQMERRF